MPPATARLDAELVRRGLARSRRRASELVAQGHVTVAGLPAVRPSQRVPRDDALEVLGDDDRYVSRAAHKLLGALDAIEALAPGRVTVAGKRCLDVGASTGGFTQVLLERDAAQVYAFDVGHDQLDPVIAADPRVTVREGTNARDLTVADVGEPVDRVVADLSFISLTIVIEPLIRLTAPDGWLLLMVKPQFEVGRERIAGGVVGSPELRQEAVRGVAVSAVAAGARVLGVVPSQLPGPAGNREYFLWLDARGGGERSLAAAVHDDILAAVRRAVRDDQPTLVAPAGTRVRS
jgi:23S rRNA (cytidine1920-2'-O)/16S rRNA (cytidine1409-2'-O)-methyltransferase